METLFLLKLLVLPVAVVAPGFFAGSETALTSLSRAAIAQLKARFPGRRALLEFWENFPDKILTTIVLGNTLATVFAGVLAASIGKDLTTHSHLSTRWTIPLSSMIVTALVLLFGEVLPKILGRLHSERLAPWALLPLVPLTKIFHPLVQLLVRIAGFCVHLVGLEPQREIPTLTLTELQGMLESESASGSVRTSRRILKNILEFGRMRVREVQKPRDQILAADIGARPEEVIARIARQPYSRVPAVRGSLDNIAGIIYAKDLLTAWRTAGLILIPDLLRPAYFASQETPLLELLREFKKGHHHFAVVRDPAKKVSGIITIEDVIEEITGEIYDESKIQ